MSLSKLGRNPHSGEYVFVKVAYGEVAQALMRDAKSPQIAAKAAVEAINIAGPFVQAALAVNTPFGATGKARQMVTFEPANLTGYGPITGFVGYGSPASLYIGFANDGTRPHFPPIQPLQWWAARVLGDYRAGGAVARHIARYGTRPQKFVERTVDMIRAKTVRMMAERVMSYLHSIGG